VGASRSPMISGQEPERPSAAMRSSSAFFSIGRGSYRTRAADGLVELVEDRAGQEQILAAPNCSTAHSCLVAERGFERVEIGVGA
jgi:hypothetical protein